MSANTYKNDPEQTAIAIGYKNAEGIADMIMPRVKVGKKDFKYNDYGLQGEYDLPEDLIGRKGRAQNLEFGSEQKSGSCEDRGYFAPVPEDDIDEAVKSSMPNPINTATLKITKTVHRRREVRVAEKTFNPANYEHSDTLAAGSRFDVQTVNPVPVLLDYLDTPLVRPNIGVIGQGSWTKLRVNPFLIKAFNGSSGDAGAITKQFLADLLELQDIYIGRSRIDIAKLGKPNNIVRAWDRHMAFHYRESILDRDNELTWGFTAQYGDWVTDLQDVKPGEMGLRGGQRALAGETVGEIVCGKGAGFLVQNATS